MNYEEYCRRLRQLGVDDKTISKLARKLLFFTISTSIFTGLLVDSTLNKFGGVIGVATLIVLTYTLFGYASADEASYEDTAKFSKISILFGILLILIGIALKIML